MLIRAKRRKADNLTFDLFDLENIIKNLNKIKKLLNLVHDVCSITFIYN